MSNELKHCPFCGNRGAHEENCYINLFFESEVLGVDIPFEVIAKAFNQRAELTCKMPMVYEDDEGNDLYTSAAYYRHYKCSNCGEIMEHYKHDWWNYCPHCGAKVVE